MAVVTVYSTDHCSFCERAKSLLKARGHSFQEINLERDPDGRGQLIKRTGMMTFPQILIGDEVVGGFNELLQADRSGRLAQLVAEAA
jgi:glutaredoxin 3